MASRYGPMHTPVTNFAASKEVGHDNHIHGLAAHADSHQGTKDGQQRGGVRLHVAHIVRQYAHEEVGLIILQALDLVAQGEA